MNTSEKNTLKNESHYDKIYQKINIKNTLNRINNLDEFLLDATQTDTSWVGMYYDNFQDNIKGKKILELGCGDCLNAAVMAALGAEVYANDISQYSGKIIEKLNANYQFKNPIQFVSGDFLKSNLPSNFFDIIVGKAFVHHLTHEQEIQFTEIIVDILKPNGIVRYFEPAINSKTLDKIRWLIPVSGRPSSLQTEKFKEWKANDPHPDRDNSSYHYKLVGAKYFEHTKIVPIGSIERFHRILPKKNNRKFRRLAFKLEKYLPEKLNLKLTRSHLIEYRNPKKSSANAI
jgi:2-polyprenyl-3-methyl-5-hydroxy-6-metoxy-1,4-benzoquinol methylase